MPTPGQLAELRRQQQLAAQGDFEVHEVIECVSSGDEGHGEEDLAPHQQVLTLQEQLTRQRELRAAEDAERSAAIALRDALARAADGDEPHEVAHDEGREAELENGCESSRANEGEDDLNHVD